MERGTSLISQYGWPLPSRLGECPNLHLGYNINAFSYKEPAGKIGNLRRGLERWKGKRLI